MAEIMRISEDAVLDKIERQLTKQDLKIDPLILLAIIKTESSFNPKALRYEKKYRYLHFPDAYAKKLQISVESETECQRFSIGLCQIILASARYIGFSGPMVDLFEPEENIRWMVRFIKVQSKTYIYENDLIASYNAGSARLKDDGSYVNQDYVNKVLVALAMYRRDRGRAFLPS